MKVNAQMSIGEILAMDSKTASIFMGFGMHCLGCPHATSESLADACAAHGADVNVLVDKLNEFFAAKA